MTSAYHCSVSYALVDTGQNPLSNPLSDGWFKPMACQLILAAAAASLEYTTNKLQKYSCSAGRKAVAPVTALKSTGAELGITVDIR